MEYQHLWAKPGILGGKVCIKDTRISVELILEWMAHGSTMAEIVAEYPQLSEAAISEALLYAARQQRNEHVYFRKAA